MGETWHPAETLSESSGRKTPTAADLSRFVNVPALLSKSRENEAAEKRAELSSMAGDLAFRDIFPEGLPPRQEKPADRTSGRFETRQETTKRAQEILYAKLGIDPDAAKNAWDKRFLKGLVDGALLSGADFAETVLRDPGAVLGALSKIDLAAVAESVSETVSDLASADWYRFGKGLGESGVAITGA